MSRETPSPSPSPSASPRRLVVVGGGIAGLACAWEAMRRAADADRPWDVMVLESSESPGGKLTTVHRDGFVVEGAPDSFLTTKPWAVDLCLELGLGDRLIPTRDDRRRVYVLWDGRLQPMPEGVRLMAPTRLWPFLQTDLLSWRGKLRAGLDLVLPGRDRSDDESVGHFVRRRLGVEVLERLAEPIMAGIYVADPDRLSLGATFPRFQALEREHGSIIRGLRRTMRTRDADRFSQRAGWDGVPDSLFVTPRGGTAEVAEALARALGDRVRTGCPVVAVRPGAEMEARAAVPNGRAVPRSLEIELANGTTVSSDAVVLATPAHVTAKLLESISREAAQLASGIRHVSTATVSLGFRREDVAHPLDGFGFVVPSAEPARILACTWTSTKLDHRAPDGHVLLRAFVGGIEHEEDVDLPSSRMVELVRDELARVMGLNRSAPTVLEEVFRWPSGTPQYDVGHLDRVARLDAVLPAHVAVAGSAWRGVGIPDTVRGARSVAEAIITKT